ncbi:thiamine phosphate synthase [Staphylococcus sp. NAM3COL9]|uniref:thiamine phosphate synthase n=1 Tax=Staphylococcus sp. NAM3COL9 TaxID=1667172 RepID=UPI0007111771|nr:thiamine phosphate synthase [Staphylococcus sp. NAM3COL9]KRG08548.1 thiamine monophosphate synthase [Staphylococcus sp. NAM3COL9]
MFIAITQYKYLKSVEIKQYINIKHFIDYLIIRTPMETPELIDWINLLSQSGFPKSKIIIHDNLTVLTQCKLCAIHFKEKDERIADFKYKHPDIQVSMSTHDTKHIAKAEVLELAFVLYGHIFKTNSKPNQHPRTENEINKALKFNIPIIALGGINTQTLKNLPNGFKGIAGISIFAQQNINEIKQLKEAWKMYV